MKIASEMHGEWSPHGDWRPYSAYDTKIAKQLIGDYSTEFFFEN